ncbi:hypothetical protein ACFX2J_000332 [Malus domestica]
MAAYRDTAGKILCLLLSYFETPRLGHVACRCATRAGSPRPSAVRGCLSLYDLSRQVLFSIWIGIAWKECASLSSGRVVHSEREI